MMKLWDILWGKDMKSNSINLWFIIEFIKI